MITFLWVQKIFSSSEYHLIGQQNNLLNTKTKLMTWVYKYKRNQKLKVYKKHIYLHYNHLKQKKKTKNQIYN